MEISKVIKLLQNRMDITGDMEIEIVHVKEHSIEHFDPSNKIEFHCKDDNAWVEWKIEKAGEA